MVLPLYTKNDEKSVVKHLQSKSISVEEYQTLDICELCAAFDEQLDIFQVPNVM